jgi:prepilin-type N-terminal cleavage/methylation domain-containing protein
MMKKRGQYARLADFGYARNTERGMTLIEVLIAMGILAAVAVVFLVGMSVSSKGVIVSQERVAVDSLAKSELEYVKSTTYNNVPWSYQLPSGHPTWDPGHSLPNGYNGYSVQVTAALVTGHTTDDGIQQITITITRPGQPDFTLVGYKVNR